MMLLGAAEAEFMHFTILRLWHEQQKGFSIRYFYVSKRWTLVNLDESISMGDHRVYGSKMLGKLF